MTWSLFEQLLDCPAWLGQQHVWRYVFASQYAKQKIILDLACGVGYGSELLGNIGHFSVGLDNAANTIFFAQSNYLGPNTAFVQGNGGTLPFDSRAFQLITSFETIEHLLHPDKYLSEIKRVISDDGIFLCSTPNRIHSLGHIDHVREFTPEELSELLKRYFKNVKIYIQTCTKQEWETLNSHNRGFMVGWRRKILRGRRITRWCLEKTSFGTFLVRISRSLLGRSSPTLKKQKAIINEKMMRSLNQLYSIRPIDQAKDSLIPNSLLAVCSEPRSWFDQVAESIKNCWPEDQSAPPITVIDSQILESPSYRIIIETLVDISKKTKWACSKGPLLNSRRWEYPWAITTLEPKKGMIVLDAGCSLDPLTPYLAKLECAIIGIDNFSSHDIQWDPNAGIFQGTMTGAAKLGLFKDYCRKILGHDISYQNQDMALTNFPPGYFEKIVCISVLEHLPSYKRKLVLKEWSRILSSTGKVVLTLDYIYQEKEFNIYKMLSGSPFELEDEINLFFPSDGSPAVAGMVLRKKPNWEDRPNLFECLYRQNSCFRKNLDSLFRCIPYYWNKVRKFIKH